MKNLVPFILLLLMSFGALAQVKIGNNPATINPNSLLELESPNKGFVPPRVILNDASVVTPLTGTVLSGTIVYSEGGSLGDGYYYWNGTAWRLLATSNLNTVTKATSTLLIKSETMVLASNDITLTLPDITASDNGLAITVKHVGAAAHLIVIKGNGAATIDDADSSSITRYCGQTFVAHEGNWIIKEKRRNTLNLLEVNENSSWTTLQEVVDFLKAHMNGPTIVRLGDETYEVASTLVINLPYPVTFQGLSYGTATIVPDGALAGKPMFRCISDCYFKMLQFDGATGTYGTAAGEDAIRFIGNGTYNEVKDCTFDRFYNAILDSSGAEIWVFETDISRAQSNGILVHSGEDSATVKVAETDFIGCNRGVYLSKGVKGTIQLASGAYYNAGGTAILYNPANFINFLNISITGNSWNNSGTYISGFDFTRSDERDADVILESNAGMGDQKPTCFINVLNSATTKMLTAVNTWYVADWGANTASQTCKWTVANNKITYQPTNSRNGSFTVSGNLSVNSTNQNISIGIVKGGDASVRYGETTLRVTTADQPFQFSFIANLPNIAPGEYFEIYYSNASSAGKIVKIQDIQWLANTQ